MLRKGGIIGIAVVIGLIYLLSLFLTNAWLERQLESVATSVNGAKVELDGFNFSFFSSSVSWDRLQVTNPADTWKNSVETAEAEFDLEFIPLLSGKVIIENSTLSGIKTNTDRETDGKIEKEESAEEESNFVSETMLQLENNVKDETGIDVSSLNNKINVDSLIKILDLKTPGKIVSLQKVYNDKFTFWDNKYKNTNPEKDLKRIESEVKKIKANDIKSPEQIITAFKALETTQKLIDSLKNFAENTTSDFQKDFGDANSALKDVPAWINEDYNKALSMAKLPEVNAQNIARVLFGAQIVNQFNTYLGYIATAREYAEYIPEGEPKEPEPPRFEGQDIHFSTKYSRPDFWLKMLNINGSAESGLELKGIAQNIVSDMTVIDTPTTFKLTGTLKERNIALAGLFDYRSEIPAEEVSFAMNGFSLNSTTLSTTKIFPDKINKGIGYLTTTLELKGNSVNANINFDANSLEFSEFKGSGNKRVDNIVNDVIANITALKIKSKITGKDGSLDFEVSSNIDRLFADSFNKVLSGELVKAKKEIKSYISKEIKPYQDKTNKLINDNVAKLTNQINNLEKEIGVKTDLLEDKKKELEKKKEELTKGLGGDVFDIFGK